MRYGIIGTGAVGGYYGGLLAANGFDVHFLLHSDYDYVKHNGLFVESINGDFRLPEVNAYRMAQDMPLCDVTVVALKTTQNHCLKGILPYVVKKDGIVIALQNGLGVEKDIAAIAPDAVVMGGLCFLCSNKIGPGHIKHLDYGSVRIGEYKPDYLPAGITRHMEMIQRDFTSAKITTLLSDNIGKARWEKLVWNVPFNGLSVILGAETDTLVASPASRMLVHDIMIEVIEGAKACGYAIDKTFADKMIRNTEKMATYKTSMKLDFESGRSLEIDAIYKRPVQDAESSGYAMSITRTVAIQLEFLDQNTPYRRDK